MTPVKAIFALALAAAFAAVAVGERILDKSYYDDHTHNLLTFNVDGEGNEIHISKGGLVLIPETEYADQGISKMYTQYWVHDGSDEFTKLLEEFSSAPIYCDVADRFDDDPSLFDFSPHVRSCGTWIFHNTRLKRPTFNAYDKNGKLIESAKFDDDAIDTTRMIEGETIEIGFLGIAADRDIAYFTIPEGVAIDDLYYTPEPTTAVLILLGATALIRRR